MNKKYTDLRRMLVSYMQVGGDSALIAWALCGDGEGHRDAARRDNLPSN